MNLAEAVAGIVQQLRDAGIRATDDARDLNPPAVQVRPPEIAWRFNKGGWTATWELWCIVPDAGAHQSLETVSDLIEQVQAALGWHAQSARPDSVVLPDLSTVPGYILTFTETLSP